MLRLDSFVVRGGRRLKGTVKISGSKNAALPCLFAALLSDEESVIDNAKTVDFTSEKADSERLQKWLESLDPEELGKYKM